ncbi:hypothetical protein ACHAQH_005421 [Verticillium albo-atrum]
MSDDEGDIKPKLDATHVEFTEQDYARNINASFNGKEDIFYRGAIAAQNPEAWEQFDETTDDDRHYLRREVTHKWHLPRQLYYAIAICSLGSAVQGWDNTGANGANLSFPKEFGIEHREMLVGAINAAPALAGLFSAWAADPVNNVLGRRGTISATGLFAIFPVLAQGFAQNWWGLMVCRLFMGIGMGIKISTIPIYSAEVAPAIIRRGIVTSFQLCIAFSIFIGFCSNLVWFRIGDLAWRFQLAAVFAPAIPVVIFVWWCPESPRWLMKKDRMQDAFKLFCRIRNTEMMAARDLYYAHCQVREERNAFGGKTLRMRVLELLTVPGLRRATVASAWIVIGQQFSGINIMAFYSATIFAEAGYSPKQCLLVSMGFGLITVSARVPLIAFFVFLFSAMYGPGIGPLPSIYFSESFPVSHREIGSVVTIVVNNAFSSGLTLSFPSLLKKLGPTGAFCFYAGLNVFVFLVIFLIIPETKQRTLEELDYIFSVPTRRHAGYQVRTWLPWWVKRYIFFRKDAKLEPLYHLDARQE